MGSYSSGPPLAHAGVVEKSLILDIGLWHRRGVLQPGGFVTCQWTRDGREIGSIGAWPITREGEERISAVTLVYRAGTGSDAHDVKERVPVVWTPCRFGGMRPWFECPGEAFSPCGKRVLKLYLYREPGFRCRECSDLTYRSQREQEHDRALHRAQAIRRRLGGSSSMAERFPDKPKHMRWRTYDHLRREYDAADAVYEAHAEREFVTLERWLDRHMERRTKAEGQR